MFIWRFYWLCILNLFRIIMFTWKIIVSTFWFASYAKLHDSQYYFATYQFDHVQYSRHETSDMWNQKMFFVAQIKKYLIWFPVYSIKYSATQYNTIQSCMKPRYMYMQRIRVVICKTFGTIWRLGLFVTKIPINFLRTWLGPYI